MGKLVWIGLVLVAIGFLFLGYQSLVALMHEDIGYVAVMWEDIFDEETYAKIPYWLDVVKNTPIYFEAWIAGAIFLVVGGITKK